MKGVKTIEVTELIKTAKRALLDKKGEELVILDVQGLSCVTSFYIIVTANSIPHIKALYSELEKALKVCGVPCFRKSGTPESQWVVADYLDAVVHIFSAESRAYYSLEELWNDAKKIDV